MQAEIEDCETKWNCTTKRYYPQVPCPLHDQDPEKNATTFREALSKLAERTRYNELGLPLDGIIFPASLDRDLFGLLASGTLGLQLKNATFLGVVNLEGKTFKKAVNFDGAKFNEFTSFTLGRFESRVSFVEAMFGGDASFAETIFDGCRLLR